MASHYIATSVTAAVLRATLLAAALSAATPAEPAGPAARVVVPAAVPGGLAPAAGARPPPDAACSAGNLRIAADGGFEYRRDKVVLLEVVIYECGSPLRIAAQRAEASSLDFDNSTWTFTGAVKVRMAQGELAADNATAKFRQQKLTLATFNGAPATFEQQAAPADGPLNTPVTGLTGNSVNARGHARTIVYKLSPGEVQLIGDAWLSNGCNELNGDTVIYNLVQKSITGPASTGPGGRVRGVIRPQCKPAPAASSTP